ncbi:hypothetical protein ACR746_05650, partial [Cutibacterium avidum]|uniref:hypothetical protein n=1 Tax=Cutibacterium avidum TaxID=33010 RepID=UPI003DA3BAF5
TADSNTSAASPWASGTSPTTSPDPSWRPEDSDPDYTLDPEEPVKGRTAYQEPKKQYWIDEDTAGHGGSAWNVKEGDPRGKSDLVVSVTASGVPLRGKMIAIAG